MTPIEIAVSEFFSKEPIGFVLSEASVTEIPITFFSTDIEARIREEELMLIHDYEHEGAPIILAVLRRISRLEPYLRRRVKVGVEDYPEAIDRIEKLTYTNATLVPIAEIKAEISGDKVRIFGVERTITYVPFPGSKVFRVGSGKILTSLLASIIKQGEPLIVGTHKYSEDVEIPLDPTYLQYHVGVFGATGMGKSRLVKVLVDEIIKKTDYAVIIFDHNGMDYVPFYRESTIRSLDIVLDPTAISDYLIKKLRVSDYYKTYLEVFGIELSGMLEDLKSILEEKPVDDAVKEIHERVKNSLSNIIYRLGGKKETQQAMRYRMDYFLKPDELVSLIIARKYSAEEIIEMAKRFKEEGKPLVVDLSYEETLEAKRTIIGNIIETAWNIIMSNARKEQGRFEPINLIVVIDEAQNYAYESSYCRDQIERIAREGRKWKFGLIVASQRLARSVHPDIRANLNTVFFSRLSQTTDLNEIKDFADITGVDLSNLAQLMPREFYVAGLMNPLRKPIAIRVKHVEEPGA